MSLVTTRRNTTDDIKRSGISVVVKVAQENSLSVDHHSDIELLAKATSCHWTFAKKVLLAIKSEDLESLYERKMKNTAIKATHWPQEISKFVLSEVNSRAIPGKD